MASSEKEGEYQSGCQFPEQKQTLKEASSEKGGEHRIGSQFPEQKQTLEEDALQVNGPSIRPGVAAIKSQYVVINSISLYEVESSPCLSDVIE